MVFGSFSSYPLQNHDANLQPTLSIIPSQTEQLHPMRVFDSSLRRCKQIFFWWGEPQYTFSKGTEGEIMQRGEKSRILSSIYWFLHSAATARER